MDQDFKKHLKEAVRHLDIADHMMFTTYRIVNDKRLLIKIFEEVYNSIDNLILCVLEYEFLNKNIILSENRDKNVENFLKNLSKNYDINDRERARIKEIIEIERKHKESSVEFVKQEKVVMMGDDLRLKILEENGVKEYINITKYILKKIVLKINTNL